MQFAADGYTIAGGPLTLTGAAGARPRRRRHGGRAGINATIGAELTGSTQLVKTDAGTLVLTGTNTYTGGTAINGGSCASRRRQPRRARAG